MGGGILLSKTLLNEDSYCKIYQSRFIFSWQSYRVWEKLGEALALVIIYSLFPRTISRTAGSL